uniref:C3H1-type domain-containing protein n=1 Tax=Magallana gigas TaxID=29159 RepID=A0A8W8NJ74_MAGGI
MPKRKHPVETSESTRAKRKPQAEPIDYQRLAQEIVKLQNPNSDASSSTVVPLENAACATYANTVNELPAPTTTSSSMQDNPILSVVSQLLENTDEPVGTNKGLFNADNLISVTEDEEPLTLCITPGVINVQHSLKSKTPMFISQWTDAFLIFINIRIQKHPSEAPHLLKYMSFIREMQRLHGDVAWRTYDESFRKLRESLAVDWQKPIEELRGKCIAMSNKQNFGQPFRGKQPGKVRFCFAYNQGGKCKLFPCPYSHSCQLCNGNHPKHKCSSSTQRTREARNYNSSKLGQTK